MPELPLPDPPLRSGRLALRPWAQSDAPSVVAACRDPLIARYVAAMPSPFGEADARTWLAGQEPARRAGLSLELAIVGAGCGDVLGAVALTSVNPDHARAAVGYWLAPQARGRGVATEALRLLAGWAFGSLDLARLELIAEPDNVASQRVAERCGFVREGLLRSHWFSKGRRRDSVIYGLLPDELR